MTQIIRKATLADAKPIANIIIAAFDEPASIPQIETCIQRDDFWTTVAELDDTVIGFVFGFITTSMEGEQRRELDLLAVHPDYQGQGAGKSLIQAFITADTPVNAVRALIAVTNHRMEKALTNLGFTVDKQICALYITSDSATNSISPPTHSHLIPVITMTYNGIWLEGLITDQSIQAALSQKSHEDDIVGAVISLSDDSAVQAIESANFDFIKEFRRWHYRLD